MVVPPLCAMATFVWSKYPDLSMVSARLYYVPLVTLMNCIVYDSWLAKRRVESGGIIRTKGSFWSRCYYQPLTAKLVAKKF